jgi:hypothetical protein
MFIATFLHVYRNFSSCLPQNFFMFTAKFLRVYRKMSSCLQQIFFMFTANFNTFRQADSGPTRGGKAPAGPIKNKFSGGRLLRSVGGDLRWDGKRVDASRRNWKTPENKLPQILFIFTATFVHVYRKFFYREFSSCLPQILFMFTAKKKCFVNKSWVRAYQQSSKVTSSISSVML